MDISSLALALGSSLTAGLNLYLTVCTLGLMQRFEIVDLPSRLDVLADGWVLGTAATLFVIEFIADKIPYLDNAWDSVHSFIRVPAGALLAVSALGEIPAHLIWVAALVGGAVSFTAHGAKASTRLAVNSTPEPFTNWFLSLTEDTLSLAILWLASTHPYFALLLIVFLILGFVSVIYLFFRFLKMLLMARQSQIRKPIRKSLC